MPWGAISATCFHTTAWRLRQHISVLVQVRGFILFESVIVATLILTAVAGMVKAQGANIRRYVSIIVFILVATVIGYYVAAFDFTTDRTGGFSDFVLLAYANMTLMIVLVQVCLYVFPYGRWSMQIVDFGYYAADAAIGLVLFGVLFLLSVVQLIDSLQALLLFSSELLIESRRGAQVRLFDQKFGDVRVGGAAAGPSSSAAAAEPDRTPSPAPATPAAAHRPSAGAPARPMATAAPQVAPSPPIANPSRRTHAANYGTVGAQMTITDSRPLRQSLWQRQRMGESVDEQNPNPALLQNGTPSQGTYRPII